jgi:hypothetical protein
MNPMLCANGNPLRYTASFWTAPKFLAGKKGVSRDGQGAIVSRGASALVSGGDGDREEAGSSLRDSVPSRPESWASTVNC